MTEDGFVLEGYEAGGVVEIIQKERVDFMDWAKYFYPTVIIIATHINYYFTGNMCIMVFIGNFALVWGHFTTGEENLDNRNLSRKSEKLFMKDWRFYIPLYVCHLAETLTWIWALCLMSDKVKWEHFYLTEVKPKTRTQYNLFCLMIGFLSSLNVSCGHELIHKRDWFHKILGMSVYTKFYSSYFLDEHVQGHHKYVATLEDPATARKNESFYAFWIRETYMSNRNVWNRDVR